MNDFEIIERFMSRANMTVVQAMLMADLCLKKEVSWTFAPPALKRSLRPFIQTRDVVGIYPQTYEGDTQVYEILALTKAAMPLIQKVFQS